MPELSGSCLCGAVKYNGNTDVKMVINCHCTDCQKVTGSVYGTMLFVSENDIEVTGEVSEFSHPADSGNTLTKIFCNQCGSQVMGKNTMREGVIGLRAGTLDQKDLIAPQMNIFCDSAVSSTSMDGTLKKAARMPGS